MQSRNSSSAGNGWVFRRDRTSKQGDEAGRQLGQRLSRMVRTQLSMKLHLQFRLRNMDMRLHSTFVILATLAICLAQDCPLVRRTTERRRKRIQPHRNQDLRHQQMLAVAGPGTSPSGLAGPPSLTIDQGIRACTPLALVWHR